MADEELIEQIALFRARGVAEEDIRKQLLNEGLSKEDVNGAIALEALSHVPLGSNLMDRWEDDKRKKVKESKGNLSRTVLYLVLFAILVFCVDYYGLAKPFGNSFSLKESFDTFLNSFVSGRS